MLHYHNEGVTLTLELDSAEDLENLQCGLTNALLRLAESLDERADSPVRALALVLGAARLSGPQHKQAASLLQSTPLSIPS